MDIRCAVQLEREREQEFATASAAAIPFYRHCAFAAGNKGYRRFERLAVIANLMGKGRIDFRYFACFTRDAVAQDDRGDALLAEKFRAGLQRLLSGRDDTAFNAGE